MVTGRFAFVLTFLTASYPMLGEGHVLRESGKELSLFEGQIRTKRFFFNPPVDVDVKYRLRTRETGETPEDLADNVPDLSGTTFRSNRPTKFIIHGFRSQGDSRWVEDMADALLQAEDVNVFAVDWQEGARPGILLTTGMDYFQARTNCRTVGQTVGEFIVRQLGQPPNMVHIIGHSLGAHAAGFAGKATQREGFTVARISGLDPAGPWFKSADAEDRLDRGDAMFVDVIHTDMKWWGKREPMGHVDFYPNEGWNQPGCGRFTLGCSHGRAYELYTESIISSGCQFSAYNCSNWQTFSKNRANCDVCDHSSLTNGACSSMGYPSINYRNAQGSMYLTTSGNPSPHCIIRERRDAEGNDADDIEQCVQSMDLEMRKQIRDYLDSATDLQEIGLDEDFCSMYSDMEPAVANITAPNPNCGPEDIPVILEYIGDGKYDTVIERAADKCPVSTSDGDVTLPSATLVIALQFIVMSLCGAARMGLP